MKKSGALQVRNLDLNLLVVLDALLAECSVARAASALSLSPSAVSHALARLRSAFGDPLLVRNGGGMAATPTALTLHQPVRRAIDELQRAIAMSQGFVPARAELTLKIGVTDYGAFVLLPRLVERVRAEAPGIRILARSITSDRFAHDLATGLVDLCVGFVADAPPHAHRRTILRDDFSCVMRADAPAAARLTLDSYLAAAHLSVSPRGAFGGIVDDALARLGRTRHVAMSMPHFLPALAVAACSDLVLTVMTRVARAFATALPLRIMPPPLPLPALELSQLWLERTHHDPAYVWLREIAADVGAAD